MSIFQRVGAATAIVLLSFISACTSDNAPAATSSGGGVASSAGDLASGTTAVPGSTASPPSASTSFTERPPLIGTAASSVVEDLVSGDQARVTSQLVLPTDVTIDPSVYQKLESLNPINVDDSSFQQLSDTTAVVYAKAGADQKEWTLVLIWQNDRWRLGDTLEGRLNPATLGSSPRASATASVTTG